MKLCITYMTLHILMARFCFRRKFGRYILYSNLFIYTVYVATLNVYMTLVPAMASPILDNDRHCPIYLSAAEAANETLVNEKKEVAGFSSTTSYC